MKSCDSTRSIRCSCLRWTMAAASLATIACTGISTLIVCWVTSCNAFCQCTVLVVNWSARWTSSLCACHLASSHAYSSTRALAAAIHSGSPWPARRKNYSIRLHARTHHFDPVSDEFFPLKHHINTVFLSVTLSNVIAKFVVCIKSANQRSTNVATALLYRGRACSESHRLIQVGGARNFWCSQCVTRLLTSNLNLVIDLTAKSCRP